MFVVIFLGGLDLPEVFGPFDTREAAEAFASTVPTVHEPVVVELEEPESFGEDED